MPELISNGERLRFVRQKLNATLLAYESMAAFEAAQIPVDVPQVAVIDGGTVTRLVRDPAGTLQSADGGFWRQLILADTEAAAESALSAAQSAAEALAAEQRIIVLEAEIRALVDGQPPPQQLWSITAGDGSATVISSPPAPPKPIVVPGDGFATVTN